GAADPRELRSGRARLPRRLRARPAVLGVSRLEQARQAVGALAAAGPQLAALYRELDDLRAQLGGLEARAVATLPPDAIREAEFRVFSQFGEDGMLQFLVQRVPVEREVFVEFGVEDY